MLIRSQRDRLDWESASEPRDVKRSVVSVELAYLAKTASPGTLEDLRITSASARRDPGGNQQEDLSGTRQEAEHTCD